MWPVRAATGRGRSSSAVWVDCMYDPSGLAMQMGEWAICLLMTGVSSVKKWEVHPVSRMAFMAGAGGPQTGRGNDGPETGGVAQCG
jgi:hypothetical protein